MLQVSTHHLLVPKPLESFYPRGLTLLLCKVGTPGTPLEKREAERALAKQNTSQMLGTVTRALIPKTPPQGGSPNLRWRGCAWPHPGSPNLRSRPCACSSSELGAWAGRVWIKGAGN